MNVSEFLSPLYPPEINVATTTILRLQQEYQAGKLSKAEYEELVGDALDEKRILAHLRTLDTQANVISAIKQLSTFALGFIPL